VRIIKRRQELLLLACLIVIQDGRLIVIQDGQDVYCAVELVGNFAFVRVCVLARFQSSVPV